MKPEVKSDFPPFLSLFNPLSGNKDKPIDVKEGETITILEELHPPETEKINSWLIGKVQLDNGEIRTLGLNMSSYFTISKVYGEDTKDWIGKDLVFCGFKKLGKGHGYLWQAL